MTHFLTEFRKIILPSQVPHDLWPWKGPYPSYCNGYMYALKPEVGMKLAAVSRFTPLLPLDDIYVTGVLRDRLHLPPVGLRFLNRFDYGTSFMEWCLHCPFLSNLSWVTLPNTHLNILYHVVPGVLNYAFVQDVAYERNYWPWQVLKDMTCLFLEQYFLDICRHKEGKVVSAPKWCINVLIMKYLDISIKYI